METYVMPGRNLFNPRKEFYFQTAESDLKPPIQSHFA
jgi:hypothetical protein